MNLVYQAKLVEEDIYVYAFYFIGVMLKATARMDLMQKDTDDLRENLTNTIGLVQVGLNSLACLLIVIFLFVIDHAYITLAIHLLL